MKVIAVNLKAKMSAGHTRADQRRILAESPTVVALNEIGGVARGLMLRVLFAMANMRMWPGRGEPIAWLKTWTLVAKGREHLSDATDVGKPGGGPKVLRAKDAPWVILNAPMGDLYFVINAHLCPQPDLNAARNRLHGRQIDALAAKVAAVLAENPGIIVIVLGDLNAADRSRLVAFVNLGLNLGAPTNDMHGHQLTYVISSLHGSRSLIRGLHTDHDAVVANLKEPTPMPTPGYPGADQKTQWFSGRFESSPIDPNVEVLHTTEGLDWPTYEGGAKAPHNTAKPNMVKCRLDFRQHYRENESARALRNEPGGVETNTLNARQIELVGTCDPMHRKRWIISGRTYVAGVDYIYWPEAPAWAENALADYLADGSKRLGIPLQAPEFLPYPESYGASRVRFTFAAWRKFRGVLGHQHVPEQDHGDPGNIRIARILNKARQILHPHPQRVVKARAEIVAILADLGANIADLKAAADQLDKVPAARRRVHAYATQLDNTIDAALALIADANDDLDNLPEK